KDELLSDIVGLFEFRKYQFLEESENSLPEDINDLKLEEIKQIITICDQQLSNKDAILDKDKISAIYCYSSGRVGKTG
ncbi:6324_t:CDS:2, partial [Racocetra persica]